MNWEVASVNACVWLIIFASNYRKADRQVSRVGCHSPPNQCGDQRRGESGCLSCAVHLSAWGRLSVKCTTLHISHIRSIKQLSFPSFVSSVAPLQRQFIYITINMSIAEPFPLFNWCARSRCGKNPRGSWRWFMESLLWWRGTGNSWWVCHALWDWVHLPGHDVSLILWIKRLSP